MKIRIFDPQTNEEFSAWATDELRQKFDAIKASFKCTHPRAAIFRVKIKASKPQVKLACPDCGESLGSPIKQTEDHQDLAQIDPELIRKTTAEKKFEAEKRAILEHIRIDREFDQNWWEEYDKYLSSQAWREKRKIKIEMANYICEGCGLEAATEVHHLSYKYVPYEMLFDLVALCKFCHQIMHLDREIRGKFVIDRSTEHIFCYGCRRLEDRHNRLWCGVHNAPAFAALSSERLCGPRHTTFEPLK